MLKKYYMAIAIALFWVLVITISGCLTGGKSPVDTASAVKLNNEGLDLYKQGKYDEAIKKYDEAIAIDPNLAYAWYNKGSSLEKQGKKEEATKCYDKATEMDPSIKEMQKQMQDDINKSLNNIK